MKILGLLWFAIGIGFVGMPLAYLVQNAIRQRFGKNRAAWREHREWLKGEDQKAQRRGRLPTN